jgi:hypothetical protein
MHMWYLQDVSLKRLSLRSESSRSACRTPFAFRSIFCCALGHCCVTCASTKLINDKEEKLDEITHTNFSVCQEVFNKTILVELAQSFKQGVPHATISSSSNHLQIALQRTPCVQEVNLFICLRRELVYL